MKRKRKLGKTRQIRHKKIIIAKTVRAVSKAGQEAERAYLKAKKKLEVQKRSKLAEQVAEYERIMAKIDKVNVIQCPQCGKYIPEDKWSVHEVPATWINL